MVNETDLRLNYKKEAGDILVNGLIPVINESIRNILGTNIGTRLFNRRFGSKLSNLLFEPMGDLVSQYILMEIQQVLERYEPRVEISYAQSHVKPNYDSNAYQVQIIYRVIDSEDIGEFNSFLERVIQ